MTSHGILLVVEVPRLLAGMVHTLAGWPGPSPDDPGEMKEEWVRIVMGRVRALDALHTLRRLRFRHPRSPTITRALDLVREGIEELWGPPC